MKTKHETREQWLGAAVDLLRPVFKQRAGVTLPKNWRVSCGFPHRGKKAIGQCWPKTASGDQHWEMFISPVLAEPVRVLDVLVHELVHAGVGVKHGHDSVFAKAARSMLLEGKLTATTSGKPFKDEIATPLLAKLGAYPHAVLNAGGISTGPKKQATRLIKAMCPDCECTVRVTAKWLGTGTPTCFNNACESNGGEMQVES